MVVPFTSRERDLLTGDLPWEQKFLEKVVARSVVKKEKCVRGFVIANDFFRFGRDFFFSPRREFSFFMKLSAVDFSDFCSIGDFNCFDIRSGVSFPLDFFLEIR